MYSALKISHLPKHFEEEQLREYFAQFGTVYGIYLPRSKKVLFLWFNYIQTLNARDKAFILVNKEVAPIIASTLHNVLNFNKIMKCESVIYLLGATLFLCCVVSIRKCFFLKGEVLESYYPSWFNRTPQTVSSVEKEKLRRCKSIVSPARNAPQRRVRNLYKRIAALKRLAPGFKLNMLNGSHPPPSPASS